MDFQAKFNWGADDTKLQAIVNVDNGMSVNIVVNDTKIYSVDINKVALNSSGVGI